MKNLFLFFGLIIFLSSCKNPQFLNQNKLDRNGFEIVYVGYNPGDTLIDSETYPVSEKDSLEFRYNTETKQTLVYLLEENRYVVLNENFKILWFESK